MKLTLIASAALVALVASAPASAQVNYRQGYQQARIGQGARSGALNGRETYRLERQQRRIDHYETRSRRDGGGLSGRERVRLDRMQDRASRNIYRQKHDGQGGRPR